MKFRTKTILGIALIECILLTILGLSVLSQLQNSNEEELERRVATTARLINASVREALISYDLATLESVASDALATGDIAYVRFLDANDHVLVERGTLPEGPPVARTSIWDNPSGIYDHEASIDVSGQHFGRFKFGLDISPLQQQIAQTRKRTLAIAGLEVLLVAAFSYVLGSYLTRQLLSLRSASQTIAQGDLTQELVVTGNDELADTAVAFNRMVVTLREANARRAVNDHQLKRQMTAINALNEVAALKLTEPQAVLHQALKLAAEHLQLEFGIISEVTDQVYRVVAQVSPPNTLEDGHTYPLGVTYCSTTLARGDLLAISSIEASEHSGHPCAAAFGLKAYVGIPVWVNGSIYGTLNFSSPTPREQDFDHFALEFVRLLSRWISTFLERVQVMEDLRRSESQLNAKMQELSTILDNSAVGITYVRSRRLIWANRRMSELFGYSLQEMENQDTLMFYALPASYEEVGQVGYDTLMRGERFTSEKEMRCKDGTLLWMRISSKFVADRSPSSGSIWVFEDITAQKRAELQLRIAATAFEVQEGIVVTDAQNVILRVNRAFTEITGYSDAEVIGRKISLLKSGRHDAAFYAQMWQCLEQDGNWKGEIWNRRKTGEVYPEWLNITAVRDTDGALAHYVATFSDITLRKAAEDEVRHLAFYDPLTQLPNRRLLLNRLQQAVTLSARSKRLGALLFMDLDNFKTLNDTLGHDMGDRLLQEVGQRLVSCVRECDTVARQGGDEFVIMLEDLGATPIDAAAHTEAVGQKILTALNQSIALANQPYHCTASIGATLFGEQSLSVDDLMKHADLAMYESKAAGRNTLRFFDPQMQDVVSARATLETQLRRALQDQEFRLYYQPQVDGTGTVTGAEALLRWQHATRGLVPPAEFIELAEESGLILPMGQWVLETACHQLAVWAGQAETAHLSISVNVSSKQFCRSEFVEEVLSAIQRTGANPRLLKLELTESLLLDNVETTISRMGILKAHGIGFALDDFGTGYSSLSYLKRLPLDLLKIDQSFVRDLLTDPNDAVIARTIVALGNSLGLAVIAEGVETSAQQECLALQGCSACQGYLFGRPAPVEVFEAFLKSG